MGEIDGLRRLLERCGEGVKRNLGRVGGSAGYIAGIAERHDEVYKIVE